MDVGARHAVAPVEGDAALVVELDEDDRAVDTVVENRVVAGAAHPGKVGLVEVMLDLLHADGGVAVVHVADVLADHRL